MSYDGYLILCVFIAVISFFIGYAVCQIDALRNISNVKSGRNRFETRVEDFNGMDPEDDPPGDQNGG